MLTQAREIKDMCRELGADMVGIAAATSFTEAPSGARPEDVLPNARSVIILVCAFPRDAMDSNPAEYTAARNDLSDRMNKIAAGATKKIMAMGFEAKKVPALSAKLVGKRYRGAISLKHAAVLAGLGKIGTNTLLVNKELGNCLWMSGVVTSMPLPGDTPARMTICSKGCDLCVKSCPVSALGNPEMKQLTCSNHAFKTIGGKLEIQCWECRRICPFRFGVPAK